MADAEEVGVLAMKEQEARATLRELFLKAVGELSGKLFYTLRTTNHLFDNLYRLYK